jgi:hypothetical protein
MEDLLNLRRKAAAAGEINSGDVRFEFAWRVNGMPSERRRGLDRRDHVTMTMTTPSARR